MDQNVGEGKDLPKVEAFVLKNRQGVLERAIEALSAAPIVQLEAVAHRASGSLSLYGFEIEGNHARIFSEWLATAPGDENPEVLRRRDALLDVLRSASI
jgi:hypothetical protein